MIGLHIKVKNKYSNYLYRIFYGIDLLNYTWEINADDFLYTENGERKEVLFDTNVLNGKEFLQCISKDNYYMIFADIKAYRLSNNRVEIRTLEDFIASSCEIVLLCIDSVYIEFYCKDRLVLDKVYNNCIGDDFEKVEYKSTLDISGRELVAW